MNLASEIKDLLLKKINHFEKIDVAGPGFLNIKLSNDALVFKLIKYLENKDTYGSKKSKSLII